MQMNPVRTATLLIAGTLLSCAAPGYAEEKAGADPAVMRTFAGMNEYPKHRDGYLNISFKPARPKAGNKVEIGVRVFNLGKKATGKFKLTLFDGKDEVGKKEGFHLAPSSSRTVEFQWTAKGGFHCFVAKVEAEENARRDNDYFLRTLVVGDRRKARPYLFFRQDEIQAWKKRVEHGVEADKWFKNILANVRSFANLGWSPDGYHEIRGLVAHSAAVMFVLEGDPGMRDKAVSILKSAGRKGKVYVSTRPGSWDDRQRICGLANYCMAYDLVAPTLSKQDDLIIRAPLAKEIKHHADVLTDPGVHRNYVGSFHYYTTGFAISALALADYDDTSKGAPDYDGSGPSYGKAREWLNLALHAVRLEYNQNGSSYDSSGYLMHGLGYLGQAQSRAAGACWAAFEHVGFNLFSAIPLVDEAHKYYLRVMLPNGWNPPTDNAAVFPSSVMTGQAIYASIYPDPHDRAAARWAWKQRHLKERSADWMDDHWYYMFAYRATPEDMKGKSRPPMWPPTMFLTSHSVFRTDWSEDASYLMLNTKHWQGKFHGHIEDDGCSVQYYAKRAYLIVDPGYGQGSYPICNSVVKPWCRGRALNKKGGDVRSSSYSQSMIFVDGKRPGPSYALRKPSAHGSYYPRNNFTTPALDFGESVAEDIMGWAGEAKIGPTGISHTRSVIFPRSSDFFIVLDKIRDTGGGRHNYQHVLVGNSRKPYKSDKDPGDFVKNPKRVEGVKRPDNLTIRNDLAGGAAGEWTVESADGKDVICQAYFVAPADEKITLSSEAGWLGYRSSYAGRCKYLLATVENAVEAKYLCVLSSTFAGRKPDVNVETLSGKDLTGGKGKVAAARIKLKGGRVGLVGFQDGGAEMTVGKDLAFDGQIAYLEEKAGKAGNALLVRGRSLSYKGVKLISAASRMPHAAFRFGGRKITGHVNLKKDTMVSVRCDFTPKAVTYQTKPDYGVQVWNPKLKGKRNHRSLRFTQRGDVLILHCPKGAGSLLIE